MPRKLEGWSRPYGHLTFVSQVMLGTGLCKCPEGRNGYLQSLQHALPDAARAHCAHNLPLQIIGATGSQEVLSLHVMAALLLLIFTGRQGSKRRQSIEAEGHQ